MDYFLSPEFHIGSWAEHLSSYWAIRDRDNVLLLTYEEMKRDGRAAMRRVAEFMGVDLSADEFAEVVRRSSFDYMKAAAELFSPGQVVPWGAAKDYFIRRGSAGSSDELLTDELRQRIDSHCRGELRRLGCDFPYDEAFR